MKATVHCKNQKQAEGLRQIFIASIVSTGLENAIGSWDASTSEILYIKNAQLIEEDAIALDVGNTDNIYIDVINKLLLALSEHIQDTVLFVFGEGIGYINGEEIEMLV